MSHLTTKRASFRIRVTTFINGGIKNQFIDDCIKQGANESKVAAHIFETYYTVLNKFPDLREKEPNEIKKFIVDRIKL